MNLAILFTAASLAAGAFAYQEYYIRQAKGPSLSQLAKLQYQTPAVTTNVGNSLLQIQVTFQAMNSRTYDDLKYSQANVLKHTYPLS